MIVGTSSVFSLLDLVLLRVLATGAAVIPIPILFLAKTVDTGVDSAEESDWSGLEGGSCVGVLVRLLVRLDRLLAGDLALSVNPSYDMQNKTGFPATEGAQWEFERKITCGVQIYCTFILQSALFFYNPNMLDTI